MHRLVRFAVSATLLAGLAGLAGCSISNSSETLSDSISSPFKWSSGSSDSGGGDSAYRRDVSDYTVAFVRDGGDLDAFRTGVGRLAEQRGITDWEADVFTCASIGAGLQQAHLDRAEALRFGHQLFADGSESLAALDAGFSRIE